MLKKIFKSLFGKKEKEQSTFVYCGCGNEMCGDITNGKNQSFVRDVYIEVHGGDRNVVHYHCSKCATESFFDFDFPAPIKLPHNEEDNVLKVYKKIYGN